MASLPHPARAAVVDAMVPNELMLPGKIPCFNSYLIAGGQTLAVGSVLGRVTATGKLKLVASAAGDGSQNPIAVLQEPLSTFDAAGNAQDQYMSVIVEAYLNRTALVIGAGFTNGIDDIRDAMAARGLHVRAPGYSG